MNGLTMPNFDFKHLILNHFLEKHDLIKKNNGFHFKIYQTILWNTSFLGKSLLNFVSPDLKLHNRYYHKLSVVMFVASGAFSATKCDHDHLKSAKPPRLVFKITKIYVKTMVNNLSKCQFLWDVSNVTCHIQMH